MPDEPTKKEIIRRKPLSPEHREKIRLRSLEREAARRLKQRMAWVSAGAQPGPGARVNKPPPAKPPAVVPEAADAIEHAIETSTQQDIPTELFLRKLTALAASSKNNLVGVAAALDVTPEELTKFLKDKFSLDFPTFQARAVAGATTRMNSAIVGKAATGDIRAVELLNEQPTTPATKCPRCSWLASLSQVELEAETDRCLRVIGRTRVPPPPTVKEVRPAVEDLVGKEGYAIQPASTLTLDELVALTGESSTVILAKLRAYGLSPKPVPLVLEELN